MITADLLWNFGLLGIHAFSTNNVTCHPCPKGTLGNNSKYLGVKADSFVAIC